MWEYNNLEELYHYGVLGMRWGHHNKINDLTEKRNRLQSENNIASNKYIKTSNKLYLLKQKEQLREAKKKKDNITYINTKDKIKDTKQGMKDQWDMNGNQFKSIYGYSRSSNEGRAISSVIWKKQSRKTTANNAIRRIGGVSVVALATAPIWYPKLQSGIDFCKSIDMRTMKYDWKTGMVSGIMK